METAELLKTFQVKFKLLIRQCEELSSVSGTKVFVNVQNPKGKNYTYCNDEALYYQYSTTGIQKRLETRVPNQEIYKPSSCTPTEPVDPLDQAGCFDSDEEEDFSSDKPQTDPLMKFSDTKLFSFKCDISDKTGFENSHSLDNSASPLEAIGFLQNVEALPIDSGIPMPSTVFRNRSLVDLGDRFSRNESPMCSENDSAVFTAIAARDEHLMSGTSPEGVAPSYHPNIAAPIVICPQEGKEQEEELAIKPEIIDSQELQQLVEGAPTANTRKRRKRKKGFTAPKKRKPTGQPHSQKSVTSSPASHELNFSHQTLIDKHALYPVKLTAATQPDSLEQYLTVKLWADALVNGRQQKKRPSNKAARRKRSRGEKQKLLNPNLEMQDWKGTLTDAEKQCPEKQNLSNPCNKLQEHKRSLTNTERQKRHRDKIKLLRMLNPNHELLQRKRMLNLVRNRRYRDRLKLKKLNQQENVAMTPAERRKGCTEKQTITNPNFSLQEHVRTRKKYVPIDLSAAEENKPKRQEKNRENCKRYVAKKKKEEKQDQVVAINEETQRETVDTEEEALVS